MIQMVPFYAARLKTTLFRKALPTIKQNSYHIWICFGIRLQVFRLHNRARQILLASPVMKFFQAAWSSIWYTVDAHMV